MITIVKRLSVLALAGFTLVFIINGERTQAQDSSQATPAATPAANANLPAAQPVIRGIVNGSQTQVTGVPGSYCWPQANASTPECDVIDNPQPTTAVTVNNGDGILFTTDPAAPGPASFKGILLDDKNADGEQPQIDLTATGGIFTVDSLDAGPHRLQVTAVYPGDVEGNQPFVSDVFLLTVGAEAANATAPATAVVAVLPTVEQAATASAEPPTIEPTNTEAAVQPTVAQPSVAPTATIAPTTEPPTPTSGSAPIQPTIAPPTVASTPVPPTAASNTGTNVTVPEINVPPVELIVNGRTFDPIAVNTCVQGSGGETVCINRPTNTTVQRVFAAPGDVAQINFKGPRPTSITVTQLSSDGTKTIGKQTIQGDNLVLYTLPSVNGNFVLDIQIVYPQGKVDYFFRLAIGS